MTRHLTADLRTPLAEHRAERCARHQQAAGITRTRQRDGKREQQPMNRRGITPQPRNATKGPRTTPAERTGQQP